MSDMRDNFASTMLEKHLVDWDIYYPRQYAYVFPHVVLPASDGTTPTVTDSALQIQQDAPFVITGFMAQSTSGSNAALDVADIDVYLFDSGASAYLSNAPVPLNLLAGQGGQNRLPAPVPYMIEQNTILKASFTNRQTSDVEGLTLVAVGYKIIRRLTPVSSPESRIMAAFGQMGAAARNGLLRQLAAMR